MVYDFLQVCDSKDFAIFSRASNNRCNHRLLILSIPPNFFSSWEADDAGPIKSFYVFSAWETTINARLARQIRYATIFEVFRQLAVGQTAADSCPKKSRELREHLAAIRRIAMFGYV